MRGAAAACALAFLLAGGAAAQREQSVARTRHNLSTSGPGPIHALSETRICIFCHTPHNATPLTPLWNRRVEPQTYQTYTSSTLKAHPSQPDGPTKLCLTCHDGTVATGSVVVPTGGIPMVGGGAIPAGTLANFGFDLSGHHPVSFHYEAAMPNPELASPPPREELTFGGADEVHCTTCHDPHDDSNGKFLVKDNRFSTLCTTCHKMTGWQGSAHATSSASVAGILPRPPKTFPQWQTLGEWGCETCHTPHFAPTAEQLLNFTDAPPAPFTCTSTGCHSGNPTQPPHAPLAAHSIFKTGGSPLDSGVDIAAQMRKPSAHQALPGVFAAARPGASEAARGGLRGVTCADCHDPHAVNTRRGTGPLASGLLGGVSGVDRNGAPVQHATYEYEVCFKCHAEGASPVETIPRVVATTNTRLEFDPTNRSFHPVVASALTHDVPSLGTSFEPGLHPGDQIQCTSCHADDQEGSRGPHGSAYPPILRLRYETADGTVESLEAYALCYRCHDRASILADVSFRKATARRTVSGGGHSGHLRAGIACAACHDPHGVPDQDRGRGETGSHEQLVNFDLRVAQPLPGLPYPVYQRTGSFAGSCTLVCHGVTHDKTAYP